MRYLKLLTALAGLAIIFSCDRYEQDPIYHDENFFRFDGESGSISEVSPTPAKIPVVFSSGESAGANGSVNFEVVGGVEGQDYEVLNSSNTLTFSSTGVDTIFIQPVDNDIVAGENIVLSVRLMNANNGSLGFPGPASDTLDFLEFRLEILDDDCVVIPIGGVYESVTTGTSTDQCCPNPAVDFMSTVTITPQGSDIYRINDFSAGLYLEWYDIYGITSQDQTPVLFELVDPVNGIIEFLPGQMEPFQTVVSGDGVYDACTGVITYEWTNGYNDEGTVTLTPQ